MAATCASAGELGTIGSLQELVLPCLLSAVRGRASSVASTAAVSSGCATAAATYTASKQSVSSH
jgi:hypothetical protein